jgi:hypothetical protein
MLLRRNIIVIKVRHPTAAASTKWVESRIKLTKSLDLGTLLKGSTPSVQRREKNEKTNPHLF